MSPPWMPLYVADYLSKTQHLTAAESGAYLHLIMHYWLHRGLPREERALARIARLHPRQWRLYRDTVVHFFDLDTGGYWKHRRIDTELRRCDEISSKRRGAALAKAQHKLPTSNGNALHMDTHSQLQKKTLSRKKEL